MSPSFVRQTIRNLVLSLVLILASIALLAWLRDARSGRLELDAHSQFSHIRIRRDGDVRTLLFVRDDGREIVESRLDLRQPHKLMLPYSQAMFASYLFRPFPQRVLIVGLGGGAMVQFLKHHQPNLQIDVVEIDPMVIDLAREYFGTYSTDHIHIHLMDAFHYLAETQQTYDVIYMDAFLKPSAETDATGVPQRLKTVEFLRALQAKLVLDGLVVFNLNLHTETADDISAIAAAFAEHYEFPCTGSRNLVVAGLRTATQEGPQQIARRAAQLDDRLRASFSFQKLWASRRR